MLSPDINISARLKGSAALQMLLKLSSSKLKHCLWKSVDRLEQGCFGETDLDLLVAKEDALKFHDILLADGWLALKAESWRDYPGVSNYIFYDKSLKRFIHIHLHTDLVMGEERIKSVTLPLQNLYLNTAIVVHGIPAVHPALEFIVLLIRLPLKIKLEHRVLAYLMKNPESIVRRFEPEYRRLKEEFSVDDLTMMLKSAELSWIDRDLVLRVYNDLFAYDAQARAEMLKDVSKFRRYSSTTLRLVKIGRWFMRRVEGQGKRLVGTGHSFAFVGPDGSGKSALVSAVERRLRIFLKVKRIYLGGSPHSRGILRTMLRYTIFPLFALLRRVVEIIRGRDGSKSLRDWYYDLEDRLIYTEKVSRYKRAKKALARGEIVLFERFPVFPGYGDGIPQGKEKDSTMKQSFERFDLPDLLFALQIDASTAQARKIEHTASIIEEKVRAFDNFYSSMLGNPNFILLNSATEPVSTLCDRCTERIWEQLQ